MLDLCRSLGQRQRGLSGGGLLKSPGSRHLELEAGAGGVELWLSACLKLVRTDGYRLKICYLVVAFVSAMASLTLISIISQQFLWLASSCRAGLRHS